MDFLEELYNDCTNQTSFLAKVSNVDHKKFLIKYLLKLEENCHEWMKLFYYFPDNKALVINLKTFGLENTNAMRNGEPLTDLKDERANYKLRKVTKSFLKLERFRQYIIDCGVEEQVVMKVFEEYMTKLEKERINTEFPGENY